MTPKIKYIGKVARVPYCRKDAQGSWLYEVRFTPVEGESSTAGNWWVRDPDCNPARPSPCGTSWPNVWVYQRKAFRVVDGAEYTREEPAARIERLNDVVLSTQPRHRSPSAKVERERIPRAVQMFVWRRDHGQCVECRGKEKIEFDHIISVVEGGSSTARNVQLLCERCNRTKGRSI